MSEINLEALIAKKSASASSPAAAAPAPSEQLSDDFSPDDLAKIEQIKNSIDITDSNAASSFAASAQADIANFSNSILSNIRNKDSAHVGLLLNNLINHVNSFDPNPSFLDKIPFLSSIRSHSSRLLYSFQKISTQIDKISSALSNSKLKLLEDIATLDILFQKNLLFFHQLKLFIRAGDLKLKELREVSLPSLQAQVNSSNDPLAPQILADFSNSIDRFDRKLHDLKLSLTISIQTAPQIRLIQNNDRLLVDRLDAALLHTIPLWKNQFIIAIGLANQQNVLNLHNAVTDSTNSLLQQNAALLKQNSIDAAKAANRSIVDIDTLNKVNQDLIETIQETLKINQDAQAARLDAENQIANIQSNIKAALLQASNRHAKS